jgi:hypothetical protein
MKFALAIVCIPLLTTALESKVVDANPKIPYHGAPDPLPSWNEGPAKSAILCFIANVTDKNNLDYVEPEERIATFDNDGTLWCEYPDYVQSRRIG